MRLYGIVACLAFSSFTFAQGPQTPAASDATSAPSDALKKILPLIADFGFDWDLKEAGLWFAGDDQAASYQAIGASTDVWDYSSPSHVIAVNHGTIQDVRLRVPVNGANHVFWTNQNGQVLGALSVDAASGKSEPIPMPDAQAEVNSEFDYWVRNLERIANWYMCLSRPKGDNARPAQKIYDACTWFIQSGKENPLGLSKAYAARSRVALSNDDKRRLDDANRAVKIDPDNGDAWTELCSEEYSEKWMNTGQALQICGKSIELDAKSGRGFAFRGDIYLKNKKYDLAIADYGKAIALRPDWMWPLVDRGVAYLRRDQLNLARQDFNEVIRINPDYAEGFLDRGLIEILQDKLDAALADFQTAYKVDPTRGESLYGQGLVKRAKGDKAGGNADMARGRKLTPRAAHFFVVPGIHVPRRWLFFR